MVLIKKGIDALILKLTKFISPEILSLMKTNFLPKVCPYHKILARSLPTQAHP